MLGAVTISIDGVPIPLTAGEKLLLANLVAAGPNGLTADQLGDVMWGDKLPPTWQSSLRNAVSRLNTKVRDHSSRALIPRDNQRRINLPEENVDAWKLLGYDTGDPPTDFDRKLMTGEPFPGCEPSPHTREAASEIAVARKNLGSVSGPFGTQVACKQAARFAKTPLLRPSEEVGEVVNYLASRGEAGVVLHGASGLGKTVLAAHAALALQGEGWHTLWVTATDHANVGVHSSPPRYEAFRNSIGEVRRLAIEANSDEHTPDGVSASDGVSADIRDRVVEHFETAYLGRPLCLIVDNAPWLDPASVDLLTVLLGGGLAQEISVIATGQTNQATALWRDWRAELHRLQLDDYEVSRPEPQHFTGLVHSKADRPIKAYEAHRLAIELHRRSSGMPGLAAQIVADVDPKTLQLRPSGSPLTGYAAAVERLAPEIRLLGASASLIGSEFSAQDLIDVCELHADVATDAITILTDLGYVEEAGESGDYRFNNYLVASAFANTASTDQRRTVHVRSLDRADDDRSRAYHSYQALLLGHDLDRSEVVGLQLDLAEQQMSDGHFRRAAATFDAAQEISVGLLPLSDRIDHLRARERGGIRSEELRTRLVAEAISLNQHSLALRAAIGGSPHVEDLWGDTGRLAALHSIDRSQLDHADRVLWAKNYSRQLVLSGSLAEAKQVGKEAWEEARTADDKAEAWISINRAAGWASISGSLKDLHWFNEIQDPDLAQVVRQAFAISLIANGKSDSAYPEIVEYTLQTQDLGYRALHWFSLAFQATALVDRGDQLRSVEMIESARRFGGRNGLSIAHDSHSMQQYMFAFHQRTHGDLYSYLQGQSNARTEENRFYRAGLYASEFAINIDNPQDRRQAAVRAAMLCQEAKDSQFATDIVGLLATPLLYSGKQEAIEAAREKLAPLADRYLLVGSAVGNLGPCRATLAQLHQEPARRVELLRHALAQADEDKLALWRVACRADLSVELSGTEASKQLLIEARALTTTPWLKQVLDTRIEWGTAIRKLTTDSAGQAK